MFESVFNRISTKSKNNIDFAKNTGIFAGIVGICTNTLLAIVKIIIGLTINSISIVVDSINNFSDIGSSVITILGFHMASKPADEEHPFGHGRAEYISALILSMIVIFVGLQFMKTSFDRAINPSPVIYSTISVVILILSIVVKIFQAKFYKEAGKKIHSKTLIAASLDSMSDIRITSIIIVSLIFEKIFGFAIDGYIGLVVSVLIIYNGWGMVKEVIDSLLGSAPDEEFIETILSEIKSVDGIRGCHDLIIHNYGEGRIVATAHAEVSDKLGLVEAHDIIDNAERVVSEKLSINLLLHLDPIDFDCPMIKKVYDDTKALLRGIDERIDIHDFRFLNNSEDKIMFDLVLPLDYDEDKIYIIKKYIQDYVFAKYNIDIVKINLDRGNTII